MKFVQVQMKRRFSPAHKMIDLMAWVNLYRFAQAFSLRMVRRLCSLVCGEIWHRGVWRAVPKDQAGRLGLVGSVLDMLRYQQTSGGFGAP